MIQEFIFAYLLTFLCDPPNQYSQYFHGHLKSYAEAIQDLPKAH